MTIRSSETFSFDGVDSSVYNILNVNLQQGMTSEPLVAPRSIMEVQPKGVDVSYFQGIQKQCLEFDLTFAFADKDGWGTKDNLREVTRWLTNPTYYAPLTFSENPDVTFYAICTNEPQLVYNGTSGYITIHFKTNAPYAFANYVTVSKDFTVNPSGTDFTVTNHGDFTILPTMQFTKRATGTFTISNNSNGGEYISFSSIPDGVIVEIDMNTETIVADDGKNYFPSWNGKNIHFLRGDNVLHATGTVELSLTYQELVVQY